ncbi:MAG: hypothetical protein JKY54_17735 [Flavobacteriales bacterium]|nr:hypothetical protein [Flavobacteriales bacterium]
MNKLVLYIDGEIVDLFKDEQVNINRSVQNIRDISKVFSDFTQSFTVPASKKNNTIFKHYYNADITGGFNAKVRVTSNIEINHLPFKNGKIQLEKVKLKRGKADSYQITFYGDVVKLTDLFGEDKISSLDLSALDHTFNSANVKLGIQGVSLKSGDIIYPLISQRYWAWESQATSFASDDIEFSIGSQDYGIVYNELKPAVRINKLIEAIETKYSITFSNDFFNTSNHFDELYLWGCNSKLRAESGGSTTDPIIFDSINSNDGGYSGVTGIYTALANDTKTFFAKIVAASGFDTVEYTVDLIKEAVVIKTVTGKGTIDFNIPSAFLIGDRFSVKITSNSPLAYTGNFKATTLFDADTTGNFSLNGTIMVNEQLPDIKVIDFLTGIFKQFNLVIVPSGSSSFFVDTLDEWYIDGKTEDITKFVDVTENIVSTPRLHKEINFRYEETETIIGEQFRNTNNDVGYGDLENSFVFDGDKLDIMLPFENLVGERLTAALTSELTNLHVIKSIDEKLESILPKPFIFYLKGQTSLTVGSLALLQDNLTAVSVTTINQIGQSNNSVQASITQSLNFGSEIDTFTLQTVTESLYSNYWEDYVTDLYDNQRRMYNYEATLPVGIIISLELNDKVIIHNRKYIINNMNINLNTGKTKLVLLNDV